MVSELEAGGKEERRNFSVTSVKFFARVNDGKKNTENLKANQYFIVDCCSLWNFKCNTCIIIQLK